jgi:hypothetical protein
MFYSNNTLKLISLLFMQLIFISEVFADHFVFTAPSTTSFMSFYGDVFTIYGDASEVGDEIAVYDQQGTICGHVVITYAGFFNFSVYGDESSTPTDEGASIGEDLVFKVWDASAENVIKLSNSMIIAKQVYSAPPIDTIPPKFIGNNEKRGMGIAIKIPGDPNLINPKYTRTIDNLTWTIIPQEDNSKYIIEISSETYSDSGRPFDLTSIESIINIGSTFSWEIENYDPADQLSYTICIDDSTCYTTDKTSYQPLFKEDGQNHTWQVFSFNPDTLTTVEGPKWTFTAYKNKEPEAEALPSQFTVAEDHTLTGTLSHINQNNIYFTKPQNYTVIYELDEPLTYYLKSLPEHGQVTLVNAHEQVTRVNSVSFIYTPNENYFGNDTFSYYVTDRMYTSNMETISLTVVNVCDPVSNTSLPEISGNCIVGQQLSADKGEWDTIELPKEFTRTIQWLNEKKDIIAGNVDTLMVSHEIAHQCIYIQVTAENICGEYTTEKSTCVYITNSAPKIQEISNIIIRESSEAYSYTLEAIDIDHDTLTWNAQITDLDHKEKLLPVSIAISQTNPATITLSKPEDYFGTIQLAVSVEDPYSGKDHFQMSITVTNVNDPPDFTSENIIIDEDTPGKIVVKNIHRGGKIDIENEDLSFEIHGDKITPDMTDSTVQAFETTATWEFVPLTNFFGQTSVEITATDYGSLYTTHTITVTANPINDTPVNIQRPIFTGEMLVGYTLTAFPGKWDDSCDEPDAFTGLFEYQWERSPHEQNNFQSIDGATEKSYTLTVNDAHQDIRVVVTAVDHGGAGQETCTCTVASMCTIVNNSSPKFYDRLLNDNPQCTNNIQIIWRNIQHNSNQLVWHNYEVQVHNPAGKLCSFTSQTDDETAYPNGWGTVRICPDSLMEGDILTFKLWNKNEDELITLTTGMFMPEDIYTYRSYPLEYYPEPLNQVPVWQNFSEKNYGLNLNVSSNPQRITVTTIMDEDAFPKTWHLPPNLVVEDIDGVDELSFQISTSPVHGFVTINDIHDIQSIRYTPTENYFGTDLMTLTVSDAYGGQDQINILTYITPRNDPPVCDTNPPLSGNPHFSSTQQNALSYTGVVWIDYLDYPPDGKIITFPRSKCSYYWQRSTSQSDAITIPNASSETYTVKREDNGNFLRAILTCKDEVFSPVIYVTVESDWIKIDNKPPIIEGNISPITVQEDGKIVNYIISTLYASDPDEDPITWKVKTTPEHGECNLLSNDKPAIYYTPNKDYYGQDSLEIYVIDHLNLASNTKTITFDVKPVNDAPINIKSPSLSAEHFHVGYTLTLNVGEWDDYTDRQYCTSCSSPQDCQYVTSCTSPQNFTYKYRYYIADDALGKNKNSLEENENNYKVTSDNHGKYIYVEVTAYDNGLASRPASSQYYTITNKPPDIKPAIINSHMSEDGIPVPWQVPDITVYDPENDPLTWTIESQPISGIASIRSNQIMYTPFNDENGSDVFNIIIEDGYDKSTATINVNITPVDDPPEVKNPIGDQEFQDTDSLWRFNFFPNIKDAVFSDIDSPDELIVPSVHLINDDSIKTPHCENSFLKSYTITEKILELNFNDNRCLNVGESHSATFTYTGTSEGLTVSKTFSVTIQGTDQAPEVKQKIDSIWVNDDLISIQNYSIVVNEDDRLTPIALADIFTDVDNDDDNDDERISYTVTCSNTELLECNIIDNDLSIGLKANEYGQSNILIKAISNDVSVSYTKLTMNVNEVDDPPEVKNHVKVQPLDENIEYTRTIEIQLDDVFSDVDFLKTDQNDAEDITKTTKLISLITKCQSITRCETDTLPPAFTITPVIQDNNDLIIEFKKEYHINTWHTVIAEITITATSLGTDGLSSVSDAFVITINGIDEKPYVDTPSADIAIDEDEAETPSSIDLHNTFKDNDNDVDQITKTWLKEDVYNIIQDIQLVDYTLTVTYTDCNYLNVGDTENAGITVVGHSNGLTTTDYFSISISGLDDPPELANPMKDITIYAGKSCPDNLDSGLPDIYQICEHEDKKICVTKNMSDVCNDVDNDNSLITFHPDNNQMTFECNNGNCTFYIDCIADDVSQAMTYEVKMDCKSNGVFLDKRDAFVLTIDPDHPPFVANPISPITVNEDELDFTVIDISNTFSDPDNKDILITKEIKSCSNGDVLTALLENNTLTIEYDANRNGLTILSLLATSNGKTVAHDITVTVNPINDPPNHPDNIIFQGIFHPGKELQINPDFDLWNDDVDCWTEIPNCEIIDFKYFFYLAKDSSHIEYTVIQSGDSETYTIQKADNNKAISACVLAFNPGIGASPDCQDITDCLTPYRQEITVCTPSWTTITNSQPNCLTDIKLSVYEDHSLKWSPPPVWDSDGDPLTITSIGDAKNGTLTLNPEKTHFYYKPDKDWSGTESFHITIYDGLDGFCSADIEIKVTPVDDPPFVDIPLPDLTVCEDKPSETIDLTYLFSDNDSDVEAITKSVSHISNPQLMTSHIVGNDLTLSFIPNANGTAFVTVIGHSNGLTDSHKFRIEIKSVNDPPHAPDHVELQETSHPGHYIMVNPGIWHDNTDNPPGKIEFTYEFCHADTQDTYCQIIQEGNDNIYQVKATDKRFIKAKVIGTNPGYDCYSETYSRTAEIESNWCEIMNTAPFFVSSEPISVTIDEDVSPMAWYQPVIGYFDADDDSVTWSLFQPPEHGNAAVSGLNDEYLIEYTPTLNWNSWTKNKVHEPDQFIIEINDGLGGTDTARIYVYVNPRNDPPQADELFLRVQNRVLKAYINGWNDSMDKNPGLFDEWKYVLQSATDLQGANLKTIETGTVEQPDEIQYAVDNELNQYFRIILTATDNGEGLPLTQSVTANSDWIMVENQPPWFDANFYRLDGIDEDHVFPKQPVDSIKAYDDDEKDTELTFAISTQAQNGIAVVTGKGPRTGASPSIGYTPNQDWFGEDSFVIKVKDQWNGTGTMTVLIKVHSVNDPPTIDTVPDQLIEEDSGQHIIKFKGISAGPENENQEITWYISTNKIELFDHKFSESGWFDLNHSSSLKTCDPQAQFSYKSEPDAFSKAVVTIALQDNDGTLNNGKNYTETTFLIDILPINDQPYFTSAETKITGYQASNKTCTRNFATNISPGADNEWGQELTFIFELIHGNRNLFPIYPYINIVNDVNGDLCFQASQKTFGNAIFAATLFDGDLKSKKHIFSIDIKESILYIQTEINPDLPGYMIEEKYQQIIEINRVYVPSNYEFLVERGALPKGLKLNGNEISGTFEDSGRFGFTISVQEKGTNHYASKTFYINVDPTFKFKEENKDIPTILENKSFLQTIHANGGEPPYFYTRLNNFPFSFEQVDDYIMLRGDAPYTQTIYTIDLMATDSKQRTTTYNYILEFVNDIQIHTERLPDGIIDKAYGTHCVTATGGAEKEGYHWSQMSVLPKGLEWRNNCLTGIPKNTTNQNHEVQIRVFDKDGHDDTKSINVRVSRPLDFVTLSPLSSGKKDEWYSEIIDVEGGQPPYLCTIVSGVLEGITIVTKPYDGCLLQGYPTTSQTQSIQIKVVDDPFPKSNSPKIGSFEIHIDEDCTIDEVTLPSWPEGYTLPADNRFKFESNGCLFKKEWSSDNLPGGVIINPNTGQLSGIPEINGNYVCKVKLINLDNNAKYVKDVPWIIEQPLTCSPQLKDLPDIYNMLINEKKEYTLYASYGDPESYYWDYADELSELNFSFLSPNQNNKIIFGGTPHECVRNIPLEITVSDHMQTASCGAIEVTVREPTLKIQNSFDSLAIVGEAYNSCITVTGAWDYEWTIIQTSRGMVPGLTNTFDNNIACLKDKPTKAGKYDITLKVIDTDPNGFGQDKKTFTIDVINPVQISQDVLVDAEPEKPYSDIIIVEEKSGLTPFSYEITKGKLPDGLHLTQDGSSASISGVLEKDADHAYFEITVEDSIGRKDSQGFTIFVNNNPEPLITTTGISPFDQFRQVKRIFKAKGGVFSYEWSVDSTTPLPRGLTLTTRDNEGILTGIPLEHGIFEVLIKLKEFKGEYDSRLFRMEIIQKPLPCKPHFPEPMTSTQNVLFIGDDFDIYNKPAEPCDEIAVFGTDNQLIGRTMVAWPPMYGLTQVYAINVYGNETDQNTPLTFKVWDHSEERELSVSTSMFDPQAVFEGAFPASPDNPTLWTLDNDKWGLNIHVSTVQQSIPLTVGWNLFSFSINKVFYDSDPPDVPLLSHTEFEKVDSLNDVLESIDGQYIIIRNFDKNGAQTFDPNVPAFFNTLHYLAAGYGYWIKMSEVATLTLEGKLTAPSDSLQLTGGWNLIGCWLQEANYNSEEPTIQIPDGVEWLKVSSLNDVFHSIDTNYSIIRNYDKQGASTFDPNVPGFFNTLHYISPGYGYWIKMTAPAKLNFSNQ